MHSALVTGATGFLGSRLVRLLVARGERVKILARPGSSLRGLGDLPAGSVTVAHGDILIEHEVFRALAGCDRLYHVAAVFKMWSSRPSDILDGAIEGTRATLEAARKRGVAKIVVTSSTAAVGVSDKPEPMDEDTPFNLEGSETYIVAKWRAEQVALEYAAAGLPVVVVNPSGIVGPGDWKPTPTGAGILQFLNWGWPLRFPTSEGGLNLVDVDDVAAGHVGAMEKGRVGERYILSGENVTYEQMFSLLAQVSGLRMPGTKVGRDMAMVGGAFMELAARLSGGDPALTRKLARDYVGRYVWVTSDKAGRELGYQARGARAALLRSAKWYLYNGYVEDDLVRRIHLDLAGG
jgi:dihydroflavonol-4-reductase